MAKKKQTKKQNHNNNKNNNSSISISNDTNDGYDDSDVGRGFIMIDVARCRFQHSKIRPIFSGCSRNVRDVLEDIKSGRTDLEELPSILVLIGDDGWYYSLNNRRLWILKQLREGGYLNQFGNKVKVRYRQSKSLAEKQRYTVEYCALNAQIMTFDKKKKKKKTNEKTSTRSTSLSRTRTDNDEENDEDESESNVNDASNNKCNRNNDDDDFDEISHDKESKKYRTCSDCEIETETEDDADDENSDTREIIKRTTNSFSNMIIYSSSDDDDDDDE